MDTIQKHPNSHLKCFSKTPKDCFCRYDWKTPSRHVSPRKAFIEVRKVRVNPGVVLGHAKSLEKTTAKYPIERVICKAYSIPTGNMCFVQDNIFVGQMPRRLVVAFVDNDAFNGNYKKSPFEFEHYDITFIAA
ncbi:hypothetical protein RF55_25202, partial [Lasius niger]